MPPFGLGCPLLPHGESASSGVFPLLLKLLLLKQPKPFFLGKFKKVKTRKSRNFSLEIIHMNKELVMI